MPVPELFSQISPALFSPLSGELAQVYWPVLATLYQQEFEREPFFLARPEAISLVESLLAESPVWQSRREAFLEDAGSAPETEDEEPTRAAARRVLARLESTGWIHFEYRSGHGDVLNFHPGPARILEALMRVARDEQPVFQGFAHAIASLLKPDTFAARPGVSLSTANRQTLEMVRELKILDRNIYARTRKLVEEAATAAHVLEHGLDRYQSAVMANYHRLKTVDNLYKWRGEILYRLDLIDRDPLAFEGASRWYAEQHALDTERASERVREDLAVMRQQFEDLPELTDDIDARNARFSGVALRKLMYLLRQDHRTESQLQALCDALARPEPPELELDVFRCELLSDGFLYTQPRARPKVEPTRLVRKPAADPDAVRRALEARFQRSFSRKRVETLIAQALAAGKTRLGELPLENDEDFVRLIHAAAYGLDGKSSYRFTPVEGTQDTHGPYRFPQGRLEKRRGR